MRRKVTTKTSSVCAPREETESGASEVNPKLGSQTSVEIKQTTLKKKSKNVNKESLLGIKLEQDENREPPTMTMKYPQPSLVNQKVKKNKAVGQGKRTGNMADKSSVHIQTPNAGATIYTCTHCGKEFQRLDHFDVHVRTHTGEKPLKCEQCGKGFSDMRNLAKHVRIHTGEKRFVCEVCEMAFTQKGTLSVHMHTHTGEKPYVCDVCEIGFTQSSHLATHKLTHTDDKPFQCTKCGAKFRHTQSLRRHVRLNCPGNPENPPVATASSSSARGD